MENGNSQTNDNPCRKQIADPPAQAVCFEAEKSKGTARAECEGYDSAS